MWISTRLCIVCFGLSSIAVSPNPACVCSVNHPGAQEPPKVQVGESERKALLARAEALKPGDLPVLFDAAEKGDSESQFLLGYAYANGKGTDEDSSKAAAWFQRAAVGGHPMAQNSLGLLYRAGKGVPKNPAEAVTWFRKAAEQNYSSAEANLGWAYCVGEGVEVNPDAGLKWLNKSADQGSALAQNILGYSYLNGKCVEKNETAAVEWFRKAATQGDALGLRNLADSYTLGQGVARDPAEALRWYQRAAEAGDPLAQYNVGWAHHSGQGVKKDKDLAEKWFTKASDKGRGQASYLLGGIYWDESGAFTGASRDYFAKAAEQRFPPGALALGDIYSSLAKSLRGGVRRDFVTACVWYSIAVELDRRSGWDKEFPEKVAAFRQEVSDKLLSVQKKLKSEEAADCQLRSGDWVKAHPSSFPANQP